MKVSSFMPAVTQMIYDLGLQNLLDGITFECPQIALKEKTPVVRCVLEGKNYTSEEINTLFSKSKATGESLYFVDEVALAKIAPDVVFTQDVCDVCQIDTECASLAVNKLEKIPELISITPQSLEDVFDNVLTISKALDQENLGKEHVTFLKNKIADIVDKQREARVIPKNVMLLEWIDPLFNCGHWIPHQIGYAGGIDLLSHPSGDSIVIDWQKIVKYNPEVLVIAPCGYTQERTLEDMKFLEEKPEWKTLRAVQNKQVYLADFDMFTQSSASTLVDGIVVLSKIFHPTVYTEPTGFEDRYCNYLDKK